MRNKFIVVTCLFVNNSVTALAGNTLTQTIDTSVVSDTATSSLVSANNIIINQEADMIAMARAFLSNPRWVWDAAKVLNHDIEVPPQYARRI